jgi:hypothetical protein
MAGDRRLLLSIEARGEDGITGEILADTYNSTDDAARLEYAMREGAHTTIHGAFERSVIDPETKLWHGIILYNELHLGRFVAYNYPESVPNPDRRGLFVHEAAVTPYGQETPIKLFNTNPHAAYVAKPLMRVN